MPAFITVQMYGSYGNHAQDIVFSCLGVVKATDQWLNGRAGPGRAGVVLALPSIYAGSDLSGPKSSEGRHYLGPYPTLKGQGRAQGFKTRKLIFFFFFNIVTKI